MQNKWRLAKAGFDYDVVAVFGSQSTGKSTLLNRLFGTRFDVMSEAQRQQTTRGIWTDRGTGGMPVLIMDVEGTDGRERGEHQDFERKSALFSLAVAEVVIVNMWENMVGLYNGANMGLLKTVMEVNLQLFSGGEPKKTLLYFVIRDHVSAAPLESLAATLTKDLARIWASLSRPPGTESATLDSYFDLKFASLPHKLLQPADFEREAMGLRRQFTDAGSSGYVFKAGYKRRVPADGFPHYASSVWEKVMSNKDLDLPTQQELLAQFRCDEIAAVALEPFREALVPVRLRVQEGKVVEDLGAVAQAARTQALEAFVAQAARYHSGVYGKKRAGLVATLDSELHAVFLNQVKNASAQAAEAFSRDAARAIEEDNGGGFMEIVEKVRCGVMARFDRAVDGLMFEGAPWSFAPEKRQLDGALDAVTVELREREVDRIVERTKRLAKDAMGDAVAEHLAAGEEDMWRLVMDAFDSEASDADERLAKQLAAAGLIGGEQRLVVERRVHAALWEDVLVGLLRDEVSDAMVLLKLRAAVEDRFRYDAQGLPRVWTPSDDIDAQFAVARESARALLPRLSRVNVESSAKLRLARTFFPAGYEYERTLVLIAPARQRDLAKRFAREADALYLEAKRSMVTTHGKVPAWVLVLLVLLGWNEAMAVLFNPLYLVLVCMVGGAALVVHLLGMWGPLLRAAGGFTGVASDQVHRLLVEAVNRTEPVKPRKSSSGKRVPKKESDTEIEYTDPRRSSISKRLVKKESDIEMEPLGKDESRNSSRSSSPRN
ncbi:Dynamin-like GTPase that mediates homotypic ER fusion [Coemansia aciculifera]|uniref:Dynamin-like GTPase that mediates homotypic ER fusion n=1 Tax=Coemansia aciculifera TaxID=417176 RepID=A0A9W8IHH2_9FUNG|nr:Dynamin-like GTPase that mediates homotypic ER fusion [Coemansia aciculifera]